jgi:hypothetical protein
VAIVKTLYHTAKKESEVIKELREDYRKRDLKKIKEYNAKFKKINSHGTANRYTRPWYRVLEIYQGYTATGRGQVSRIWETAACLGNDIYSCRLISDNTVFKINPEYRRNSTPTRIRRILKQTQCLHATPPIKTRR